MNLDRLARETLDGIRDRGTYRRMRILSGAQSARMVVEGREVIHRGRRAPPTAKLPYARMLSPIGPGGSPKRSPRRFRKPA